MNAILAPVDFSAPSRDAFRFALGIAGAAGVPVVALHAFGVYPPGEFVSLDVLQAMEEEAAQRARKEMDDFLAGEQAPDGVALSTIVKLGLAVETTLHEADRLGAGLVVMGTRGADNVADKLLGTNTAVIIENSETPVLAIPPGATFEGLNRIVFAVDLKTDVCDAFVRLLNTFAAFKPEVHIVHVESDGKKIDDATRAKFDAAFHSVGRSEAIHYADVENDDALDGLLRHTINHKADMLVMVTRDRNLWQRFFKPSVTAKMAGRLTVPLLAMHA